MPQNFQNWQSLGIDAAPQTPSSPSGIPGTEFQDWANITGPSDLLKQSVGLQRSSGFNNSASPVPPPQQPVAKTFDEAMKQAIAPITNKITNIGNRFDQAAQGNIFNAVTGQKPTAQPTPVGEQHDHEW